MNHRILTSFGVLAAMMLSAPWSAAHTHIAAGVIDSNHNGIPDQNDQLTIVSGYASGTVYHMLPEPSGARYAGYFALDEQPRTQFPNDYFTFISLSDGQFDVAAPGHAATGSYLWMEITSVTGPAGAHFGFWEEDWAFTHSTPTVSLLTNSSTGGFKFVLGEGVNAPGEDPGGHIHDRGWTVDAPGDYFVGFTLYDLSTQGTGGGPIHTPSQTYTFHFQAIPEPGSAAMLSAGLLLLTTRRRRRA